MPPPLLVVEVVSPGSVQRERDFIAKRGQYEAVGIPEYWLVDPQREELLVLALAGATYVERGRFTGEQGVTSPQFGALGFTAAAMLAQSDADDESP